MEKDALLKKINDPNRKNGVLVTITDKGSKFYHLAEKRESLNKMLSSLSKSKRDQLKSCLTILLEAAKKEIA